METKTEFEVALMAWVARSQAEINKHYAGHPFAAPVLTAERGRRYIRIVSNYLESRSAFMFIDITNGDVLKPHGWRGPEKNSARDNVFKAISA